MVKDVEVDHCAVPRYEAGDRKHLQTCNNRKNVVDGKLLKEKSKWWNPHSEVGQYLDLNMSGLHHLRGNPLQLVSPSVSAREANTEGNSGHGVHLSHQLVHRVG